MIQRVPKIGLGTVQWGIDYGVSNLDGRTPPDEVGRILATAREVGIRVLDTAALYGDAEAVLGLHDLEGFRVVTKTPRYARSLVTLQDADALRSTFERSLDRLGVGVVYGLLVHHADDLLARGCEHLVEVLCALRDDGRVANIGVSVYDGTQIASILQRFTPDLVQLPLNVFDQRPIVDGSLARLKSLGVEIHARSVFLQGLLLMAPDSVPAYFEPWRKRLVSWQRVCAAYGVAPLHAALAFVCNQREVDCCVVGVQSARQLEEALSGLEAAQLPPTKDFACSDLALINPVNWRLS